MPLSLPPAYANKRQPPEKAVYVEEERASPSQRQSLDISRAQKKLSQVQKCFQVLCNFALD